LLLKIIAVLVAIMGAVLLFATTKPSRFIVQRSVVINASPDKVYPLIADLHNWPLWAPQDKEDPTIHRTFSGNASGEGAVSSWTSKGSAGVGQITILRATSDFVLLQADWIKPFHIQNRNAFALQPSGTTTTVIWTLDGASPYPLKLMSVFVSPDGMMGKHLETGLQNLKSAAER
jgi:uncharacterized protein YndB with AHSA1/START domain